MSQKLYSVIDFADFEESDSSNDSIIINLGLPNQIKHRFPVVDRCCKSKEQTITYDNIDNMERISCNISKDEFKSDYANRRKSVILLGCQEEWKAKNWTFGNLLSRLGYMIILQS